MKRKKRGFSYAERYAVWSNGDQRCWWCRKPLRLVDVTVDHVLPESLLYDDDRRREILAAFGLPRNFNINGFENWLPSHNRCNQRKGSKLPAFVPDTKLILDGLMRRAKKAERLAQSVLKDVAKDKVWSTVFAALEKRKISLRDLDELLRAFATDPIKAGVPKDYIVLDSGYWIPKKEIVREDECRCERNTCVGNSKKVYCYFERSLSPWVIKKGLFWKCYDEIVKCPRCGRRHKRGYIGREGSCDRPYRNQETQTD